MAEHSSSFFLLVPGPWTDAPELISALATANVAAVPLADNAPADAVAVDVVHEADGFGTAMAAVTGMISADDIDACSQTTAAALVRIPGTLHENRDLTHKTALALRAAGGVAVRFESSGKAISWEAWTAAMAAEGVWPLVELAVVYGFDGDYFFSTGMHIFACPDAEAAGLPREGAAEWLHTFCAFQLDELPVLRSGHTFSPDAQTPRRTLERWPDSRHVADDGRRNPFGLWRALAPGQAGLEVLDPEPMCVPSLMVLLASHERTQGRPLTEQEVNELMAKAVAMPIPAAEARELERGRGYADIEGRLAWEQWQAVRRVL